MSLINDALKKAQKMRTQDQAAPAPSQAIGDSGPVAKRARPMSTKWLGGLFAGAAVLVAVSVLVTVVWLRKPGAAPAPKPVASPAAVSVSPPPPPVVPPTQNASPSPAPGTAPAAPSPLVVAAAPAESPPPPPDVAAVPPVDTSRPPLVASPVIRPAPAPKPDSRIQAFVDALRVTGIRASGGESKVLMNDRVFRVNDIVERSLGLRLTGVAADRLTFTDENGIVYARNF
jgi:hypothetical protein